MSDKRYTITEQKQAFNTGIAASAKEEIITGTNNVDAFNHLEVINGDAVAIQIRLDSDTTRSYNIAASTALVIDVSEGQIFKNVLQVNLDTVSAETANAILFKAMKKVEVL